MMSQTLVSLISIAVVGIIVLRSGRDTRVEGIAWVRGTMIAALIPLGLQAAVLALFGLGGVPGVEAASRRGYRPGGHGADGCSRLSRHHFHRNHVGPSTGFGAVVSHCRCRRSA